ncbi:MAG: hydrolase [Phycisphaera sp.]|nr:hydrolase [Phycisphaera sp.]
MSGYLRSDGRKGIRNTLIVVYLVECAHHVAREVMTPYRDRGVQLAGFPGCYPNEYADRVMRGVCTHPNVGAVLLVSLGCESFNRTRLEETIRESGRPVMTMVIQEAGGTRTTIDKGRAWVNQTLSVMDQDERVPMGIEELCIGTICGGSDATSGLTANPVVGRVFDRLVEMGACAIVEETNEMVGLEKQLAARAITPELGEQLAASVVKAEAYQRVLGHGSFAPGNATGGLTTQEEKSLGAYMKSGTGPIAGLLKPGHLPPRLHSPEGGLYLLDLVPDGDVRFGFPNISDNAEAVDLISCGAHMILFTTGRGSVVGSAVSPIVKVCANPETYRKLSGDMDIDAGRILDGGGTIEGVADELLNKVVSVASGEPTVSEALGHQEFILGYKRFEPLGPACLPVVAR